MLAEKLTEEEAEDEGVEEAEGVVLKDRGEEGSLLTPSLDAR